MFAPVFAAIISATIFYVVLPIVGAFVVRTRWRSFRHLVAMSAGFPEMTGAPDSDTASAGVILRGELEALGGEDELWVRTESATVVVSMHGAAMYLLSSESGSRSAIRDRVERLRWKSVTSIQPGLLVYATGHVFRSGARLAMDGSREDSLIIFHDGSSADVAEAAIRAGRHRNEYWNPVSQASWAIGVLVMAGLSSVSLASDAPALLSAVTLTAAFLPVLPILPPGLAGFLLYLAYWKKARDYRERRDVAEFRARGGPLAKGLRTRARFTMLASIGAIMAALTLNAWLFMTLLRRIL